MKIAKLEQKIATARIIDESKLDTSKVTILSTVKIKNLKNKMEFAYTLVSEDEVDLKAGKINVNSAIGKGLLGKKQGDVTEITTPGGKMEFEILEISR
jgi:transcription elongation factor GreA